MVNKSNRTIAVRKFTPSTKFTSLFGIPDIVSEAAEFIFTKDGEIFVQGIIAIRLIYTNSDGWAETENN